MSPYDRPALRLVAKTTSGEAAEQARRQEGRGATSIVSEHDAVRQVAQSTPLGRAHPDEDPRCSGCCVTSHGPGGAGSWQRLLLPILSAPPLRVAPRLLLNPLVLKDEQS